MPGHKFNNIKVPIQFALRRQQPKSLGNLVETEKKRTITHTTHIPVMVKAGRLTGNIIQRDISNARSSTAPPERLLSFCAFASLAVVAHQLAFKFLARPFQITFS